MVQHLVDVGDAISPHAGLTSTEGSHVSPHNIERNFDTIDPPNISEDNLLDNLFKQSSKGERDIINIMLSAINTVVFSKSCLSNYGIFLYSQKDTKCHPTKKCE